VTHTRHIKAICSVLLVRIVNNYLKQGSDIGQINELLSEPISFTLKDFSSMDIKRAEVKSLIKRELAVEDQGKILIDPQAMLKGTGCDSIVELIQRECPSVSLTDAPVVQ
jgi:hypothetical protein